MSLISLNEVSFSFGANLALDAVSFDIEEGDYIGLIGPNGAGKSTLLKIILGVLEPQQGHITFASDLSFGYVPQNYLPSTVFTISVREILEMGLKRLSFFRRQSETKLFINKLAMVGLTLEFLNKSFHDLSGGQKQRVIIARSLLNNPNVLLFDEPLSGVDFNTKLQIYDLLAKINKQNNTTIIFVSHEIESVIEKCHTVFCLNKNLHKGCHPLSFIQGEPNNCELNDNNKILRPIHHHHLK